MDRLCRNAAATCAADLLVSAVIADTSSKYDQHRRQFTEFCSATGRAALPSSPSTVVAYLGHMFLRGTVQPTSLQACLSLIKNRHTIAGFPPPALGAYIASARVRFARRWHERARALPPHRAHFSAAAARAIALVASKTTCPDTRRRLTTIVTAFLFFRRTAELLQLTVGDFTVRLDGGVDFQVQWHKGADRQAGAWRLTYSVPPDPYGHDLPLALVRDRFSWLTTAGAPPSQPLFSPLGAPRPPSREALGQWLTAACADLDITAPPGSFFAPYSTRGGAATVAYAVGVPDGRIVALLGRKRRDTVTAHTHYIDALLDPCQAARRIFDSFLPRL